MNVASSLNPGGFNFKIIPGTNFGAGDADGTVASITITDFPLNANYLKIGSVYYTNGGTCPPQTGCTSWPGSVTIAFAAGIPVSSVSVDPIAGATIVKIAYQATDNGGAKSIADTIEIPFILPATPLTISGNVWNDANGDGLLNGTESLTNAAKAGEVLYAVLIQNNNTYSGAKTILASVAVSATTGYTFNNVPAGSDYTVKIISLSLIPQDGAAQTTLMPALATGYVGVSTSNSGTITTGFSTNDLSNNQNAFSATAVNVNFGIDRTPIANAQTYVIATPGYNSVLTLDGTGSLASPGTLTGSDPEDQPVSGSLATHTVQIISLPTNGHELYYNNIKITLGKDGLAAPSAGNPFVIINFDPAKLSIKFTGGGSVMTVFDYQYVDAASQASVAASYSITWAVALPVKLISFTANALSTTHQISWVVSNELNIMAYELEAGTNGVAYSKIGSVMVTGISQQHSYSFTNAGTGNTKLYYRLKIINSDGTFTYSNIISAELSKAVIWTVMPNPTTGIVKCTGLPVKCTVKVTDATGREVLMITNTTSSQTLDLTKMADGAYYIRATDNSGHKVAQTIVIKK